MPHISITNNGINRHNGPSEIKHRKGHNYYLCAAPKKGTIQGFPGGPVFELHAFTAKGLGSKPGWETKILQAVWHNPPPKKKV